MDMDLLLRLRAMGATGLRSPDRVHVPLARRVVDGLGADRVAGRGRRRSSGATCPRPLIPLAPAWEAPVRWATKCAAAQVRQRPGAVSHLDELHAR